MFLIDRLKITFGENNWCHFLLETGPFSGKYVKNDTSEFMFLIFNLTSIYQKMNAFKNTLKNRLNIIENTIFALITRFL